MNQLKMAALASALLFTAQNAVAQRTSQEPSVRFVVTAGLTGGGDTLAEVEYENGYDSKVKGGGLVQIGAGLQFRKPGAPVSLLATVNYHVDNATADNGDVRFDRVPLEVLGFYHVNDIVRLGVGLRHTINATYKEDIDYEPLYKEDYKDANGLILQVGFGTGRFWGAVRYVDESYEVERYTFGNQTGRFNKTYDGSHFGLMGYFAF